jgi:L-fuculose-phosphate aldolase
MHHIYCRGMTTTSGGNLSVADDGGNIWITPAGTDKGSLKPEDIVCVGPGGVVTGIHKPSSEYPLHRAIYKARPDLRAVIHAHPPVLTAFSIVHRIPDTAVLRNAREICGTVGYAGYELPGSEMLGESVAGEFSKGHNAVIMENHAVVVGGKDLTEALVRLEALENCAVTIQSAGFIGEATTLSESQLNDLTNSGGHGFLKGAAGERAGEAVPDSGVRVTKNETGCIDKDADYESSSVIVASGDVTSADEICLMVRRACERGLMYGSCGTISVRCAGSGYLITPGGGLRCDITGEDIARVNDCRQSEGKEPYRSEWLHDEIYRRFPAVRAVIVAQPPYLMAFAVTGRKIEVRTIPESWLFLQDIPIVPFGAQLPGRSEICDLLAGGAPAIMISNDSLLVTGKNLLQAFDRLEVAEMTAMSQIIGGSLGTVAPISNENIEELRRVFPGSD